MSLVGPAKAGPKRPGITPKTPIAGPETALARTIPLWDEGNLFAAGLRLLWGANEPLPHFNNLRSSSWETFSSGPV